MWSGHCVKLLVVSAFCATWLLADGSYRENGSPPAREVGTRATPAPPPESLRTELAQLQNQAGLTLAGYRAGLYILSIQRGTLLHGKDLLLDGGPSGAGAVSHDGTVVALQVAHTP